MLQYLKALQTTQESKHMLHMMTSSTNLTCLKQELTDFTVTIIVYRG
jgi:hypothetical protein